jgi:hypothetical protein
MPFVDEHQIDDLATGAAILGTGGGGSPYIGSLLVKEAIRRFGPVELVGAEDLADDAFVLPVCAVGAPTIMVEKLWQGEEALTALTALERFLGKRATHLACLEIGGLNATIPFAVGAARGLPVVDADLMGRAFPEFQMCMPTLYNIDTSPIALADEKGNVLILEAISNRWTERLARTATVELGCQTMAASYPMSGAEAKKAMVLGTISLAESLGRTVRLARAAGADAVAAVTEQLNGRRLFRGKVVDVDRRTEAGWAVGAMRLRELGEDGGHELVVDFRNEFLVATLDGQTVATVPDLIIVLDAETGEPIPTEDLRYGFRIEVIAAPCDDRWRSEEGLRVVGPPEFGFSDLEFVPVAADAPA